MVSFSCEVCNDTIQKKKLDQHKQKCPEAYYTCLDCGVTFEDQQYRQHVSCITESEKYEKPGRKPRKQQDGTKHTAAEKASLTPAEAASLTPVKAASLTPVKAASLTPVKAASLTPVKATSLTPTKAASVASAKAPPLVPSKTPKQIKVGKFMQPNKQTSLYKVIKKISRDTGSDRKQLQKQIKITLKEDGTIQLLE